MYRVTKAVLQSVNHILFSLNFTDRNINAVNGCHTEMLTRRHSSRMRTARLPTIPVLVAATRCQHWCGGLGISTALDTNHPGILTPPIFTPLPLLGYLPPWILTPLEGTRDQIPTPL